MTLVDSMLSAIARLSWRHWRIATGAAALIVVLFPIALCGLRFDTASTGQVTRDDPVSSFYRENMARFGDSGLLIIRLTRGNAAPDALDMLTARLAAEISTWPDVVYVSTGLVDLADRGLAAAMLSAAILNSGPEVLTAFADKFTDENMAKQLRRTRKRLIALQDPAMRRLVAADPLDVGSLILSQLKSRMGNLKLDYSRGHFDSPDGTRLVFVQPKGSAEDADFAARIIESADSLLTQLKGDTAGAENIGHDFAGQYAFAVEGARTARREMRYFSLAALLLLLALLLVVFRDLRAVLICFVPLVVSLMSVLIFARLFFNPVCLAAAGFAAVVMGLSIDITIHLTGRLYQLLDGSRPVREAVCATLVESGRPVAMGVATTAAAFLCLTWAKLYGLVQFALLTSTGLLISFCVSIVLFPAAARLFAPRGLSRAGVIRFHARPMQAFALAHSHPARALGLAAVLVALSVFAARTFTFDMDLQATLPRGLESMDAAEEISDAFGASFTLNTQIIIESKSLAEAMAVQEELDTELDRWVREKKIAAFDSPSLFLAYGNRASRARAGLYALSNRVAAARHTFHLQLENLDFAPDPGQAEYYGTLELVARRCVEAGTDALAGIHDQPRLSRFVSLDGPKVFLQTYVWPLNDAHQFAVVKDVSQDSLGLDPPPGVSLHVTGTFQLYDHMNALVRQDFLRVSVLSVAVVSLFVLIVFRNVSIALLTLLPLAAAVPFMLACLVAAGVPFAPTGIGLVAMIVGIGIDDAVHVLSRATRTANTDMAKIMTEIGPILGLTSLSTMIGFGVLYLSSFRVLATLGFAIAAGVFGCLLFTVLLVPSCYRILRLGRRGAVAALLLLAIAAIDAGASETNELDRILHSLQAQHDSIDAVTCSFIQTKKVKQLVREVTLAGKLTLKKPHFIRLELRGDENMNVYANGKKVWVEDLDLDELQTYDFDPTKVDRRITALMPPVLEKDPDVLKRKFDMVLSRTTKGFHRIEMTPKAGEAVDCRSMAVVLDRWGRVRSLRTVRNEHEYSTITFRGWRRLVEAPDSLFRHPGTAGRAPAGGVGLDQDSE